MAIIFYSDPETGDTKNSVDVRIRFLATTRNESDPSGSGMVFQFETADGTSHTTLMVGLAELFDYMHRIADADRTAVVAHEMEREQRGTRLPCSAVEAMRNSLDQMKDIYNQVRAVAENFDREIPKLEAWIDRADEVMAVPPFMKLPGEDP